MDRFRTLNHTEIESYPKKEWEIIVKGFPCPEEDLRFNRRIPLISELFELPLTKKAKLQKAEVIAIVMYTGPMVCFYVKRSIDVLATNFLDFCSM
jgi:hypothetical protein